MTDRRNRISD